VSSLDEHLPTENYRWNKAIAELVQLYRKNWMESDAVSFFVWEFSKSTDRYWSIASK
jgi:hypothetical protein